MFHLIRAASCSVVLAGGFLILFRRLGRVRSELGGEIEAAAVLISASRTPIAPDTDTGSHSDHGQHS